MDGMTVPRDQAATLEFDGRNYSFCTPRCRESFRSDPGKCLSTARHKPVVSSR
ncbi:MAG: YHS domain-containing protein [Planctomycetes bacterium]|nr:YHS domain-containing protein [Planctomycetota bacterium]